MASQTTLHTAPEKTPKQKQKRHRLRGSLFEGWTVEGWSYGPPVTKNGPNAWLLSPDGKWVLIVQVGVAMLRTQSSMEMISDIRSGKLSSADFGSGWLRTPAARDEGLSAIRRHDVCVAQAIAWASLPETIELALSLKQGKGAAEANKLLSSRGSTPL